MVLVWSLDSARRLLDLVRFKKAPDLADDGSALTTIKYELQGFPAACKELP